MTDANQSDSLDVTTIRIMEAGYRSINDPTAFDDLVNAWRSRIDAVSNGQVENLLTPPLARHCDDLVRLLDRVQDPLVLNQHDTFVRRALGPAMVISSTGTVLAINQSAADQFGFAVGQRTDFGFLDFASETAIERLRAGCEGKSNFRRAILQTEDNDKPDLLDAQIISVSGDVSSALGIRTLGYEWSDAVYDLMIVAFDLSEAEAQVVGLLYRHADLPQVAEKRGTSVRTVRTQLHQIYDKTGTRGQVELICMVSLICAQEGREDSAIAVWRDPLGRERAITDSEGRSICYTWMGARDGLPAILCHGPLTGHTLRPEMSAALDEAGITLYAIIRPGFGHSPVYEGKPAEIAGAEAICSLADHLGAKRIVGIGLVNGIVPLLRASAMRPELFRQLVGLGASIPITPSMIEELPDIQSTIFRLAEKSPRAFDAFIRTGYRAALKGGPEYLLARMYEGSPADQQTLRDPDVFALLKASIAMVMTQGHQTFLADMIMAMHDYTDDIVAAAPLTMIAGSRDPVYPIKYVRHFAQERAVELVEIDGAGQTLHHSHFQSATQQIIRAFQV